MKNDENPSLEKLLCLCESLSSDYADRNYGDAEKWLRHIAIAHEEYQEQQDELKEAANKDAKIAELQAKLNSFACQVLDFNECEQESGIVHTAFTTCLETALTITGRTDS
jgi:hypothetical protein